MEGRACAVRAKAIAFLSSGGLSGSPWVHFNSGPIRAFGFVTRLFRKSKPMPSTPPQTHCAPFAMMGSRLKLPKAPRNKTKHFWKSYLPLKCLTTDTESVLAPARVILQKALGVKALITSTTCTYISNDV